MPLFNKILIANRGEIACRIMRTAKKMGIKTVAIFSEADKHSLAVKMSEEAFLIGGQKSTESYLQIDTIINLAKATNVDAIHPGYGFLSENSHFAEACEAENIVFIGPSAKAIQAMANKNLAKSIMAEHGVPVLPGYYDKNNDLALIQKAAKEIGYPIVLKALAGGGGKGLRVVHSENNFEEAYYAVRREAKAFFNDDQVLVEKYLENARHIEVQILCDHFGHQQYLFTRDCSIQRRHQKIVEEAPATNISGPLQKQLQATAFTAASAINYTNAGTIEFLIENEKFYFLEMNTRLQVEHPVTEMITDLDLVEWQIRIASGEKIFSKPKAASGHAIEIRLNAEDPEHDFLPSSGLLQYFHFADEDKNLRIDSGYREGDNINIFYDSLLAKIIVWKESRQQAIVCLSQALSQTYILGIKTNLTLLKAILNNEDFKLAAFNTNFLQIKKLTNSPTLERSISSIAGLFLYSKQNMETKNNPWQWNDGWRLYGNSFFKIALSYNKIFKTLLIRKQENNFIVQDQDYCFYYQSISLIEQKNNIYQFNFILDNQYFEAMIFESSATLDLIVNGEQYTIDKEIKLHLSFDQGDRVELIAPMPGTLVALLVDSGQKVSKGDKLLVIEAMKMEHALYAPADGTVKQCYYQVGELVKEGDELIQFE